MSVAATLMIPEDTTPSTVSLAQSVNVISLAFRI